MLELVTDCPRCKANSITFDIRADILVDIGGYDWQSCFEAFCICRSCHQSIVFVLAQRDIATSDEIKKNGLSELSGSANDYVDVKWHISMKDESSDAPPEYIPSDIEEANRTPNQSHEQC